jgi:sulfur carrier protein ThiS
LKLDLSEPAIVGDALTKLDIPPDTVIITRSGQPIPLDSPLTPDDELSVIRVLSGG